MLEHSVKLCPYRLCGGVAACVGVARVLCAVQNGTELGGVFFVAATPPNEPHQCILTHFNNCNFSKAQTVCSLRIMFFTPKHVAAF
jgi:hypothetical protein